jgi:hypothetical protein
MKLTDEEAKQVDESTNVIDEGIHEMVLIEVKEGEGPKGRYIRWVFAIPEDAERWRNMRASTVISRASEGWQNRIKRMFKAFGVPSDTDTDDILGQRVRVKLGTNLYEGELQNNVKGVYPLEGGNSANEPGESLF